MERQLSEFSEILEKYKDCTNKVTDAYEGLLNYLNRAEHGSIDTNLTLDSILQKQDLDDNFTNKKKNIL